MRKTYKDHIQHHYINKVKNMKPTAQEPLPSHVGKQAKRKLTDVTSFGSKPRIKGRKVKPRK